MTVVNKTPNPVNPKQTLTIATGIVKFIKLDKFPETKSYVYEGKKIESTHKASILLESGEDSQWVGLGDIKLNPKFEVLQIKDGDVFVEIEKGMEVSMMVKPNEYNGKTYYSSTKAKINILSTDGVEAAKQQSKPASNTSESSSSSTSSSKATGASTGTTKVYGEVKSIADGVAVVLDEKTDVEYKVVMGDKEGFVVGGRIAANIDSAGVIKSGYKSYVPKVESVKISKVQKDAYGSPESLFKMSFGNMMNVAALAVNIVDESQIPLVGAFAKELFEPAASLRTELITKYAANRHDDDVGSKLGDALKVAATVHGTDIDNLLAFARQYVEAHIEAEDEVKSYLATPLSKQSTPAKETKTASNKVDSKADNKTESANTDNSDEPPVFDNSVPPIDDFDDLPF